MKQMTQPISEAAKDAAKAKRERWELMLDDQIQAAGLPPGIPARWGDKKYYIYMQGASHPCQPDRAWPERKLLVEVQGGQWTRGRHTRGTGFEADCRKYSWYAILGYRVLFATPTMIEDGTVIDLLRKELELIQ